MDFCQVKPVECNECIGKLASIIRSKLILILRIILNIFLLSFIQHSMIYFFHHYELPVITQQAQVQNLLRFHSHQRRQQQQNNAAPNNEPPNMGDAVSTISSSSVTQNYIPWSGHAPYGDTLIWFVVFLYHVHSRPFWDEISIISPPASMCTAK